MASEFQIVHERVIITKYIDPVGDADVSRMSTEVELYTRRASQPVLAIADFSGVKQFPSSLLSMGIRKTNANPLRNSNIERLLVIADSAFLQSVVSAVTRITGAKKVIVMRTRAEVDAAIEAFISSTAVELQSK